MVKGGKGCGLGQVGTFCITLHHHSSTGQQSTEMGPSHRWLNKTEAGGKGKGWGQGG